jgi:hypothetical protein
LSAHLAADLHPMFSLGASYYLSVAGRREIELPSESGSRAITESPGGISVHTLRMNLGLRVTPQTLILAQWSEDVAGTPSAPLGRYVGLRITHVFFAGPKAPEPRDPAASSAK